MTVSLLSIVLAWLAVVSSGLTCGLITWLWLKQPESHSVWSRLVLAGGGLTALSVAGSLAAQMGEVLHWPPLTTAQSLLLWGGLGAVVGLGLQVWPPKSSPASHPQASTSFGWAAYTLILGLGAGLWQTSPQSLTIEPLWVWAGLARGLTLLGLAGLGWRLALELAYTLKLFWPEDRWPAIRAHFQSESQPLRWEGLGWFSTAALLLGLSLLILRVWWGWGQDLSRVAWPSVVISLLLAQSWLRLHRPHSTRLLLVFTSLIFISSLPLLWLLGSI